MSYYSQSQQQQPSSSSAYYTPAPASAPRPVAFQPIGPSGTEVLVRNLPADVSKADLEELFVDTVGPVVNCQVFYNWTGQALGTALIQFQSPGDALKAYSEYHEKLIDDSSPLYIQIITNGADLINSRGHQQPRPATSRFSQPQQATHVSQTVQQQPRPRPARQTQPVAPTPAPRQQPQAPKKKSSLSLAARMGPSVIPLSDRLAPVGSKPRSATATATTGNKKLLALSKVPKASMGAKKTKKPIKAVGKKGAGKMQVD